MPGLNRKFICFRYFTTLPLTVLHLAKHSSLPQASNSASSFEYNIKGGKKSLNFKIDHLDIPAVSLNEKD